MFFRKTETADPAVSHKEPRTERVPENASAQGPAGQEDDVVEVDHSGPVLTDETVAVATDGPAPDEAASASNSDAEADGKAGSENPRRQLSPAELHFAVSFTRIVSVLAKSNPYRDLPLGQIERLVVPSILTGQFAILDAKINEQTMPVAVAFWAHVSPEVDQRLSAGPDAVFNIRRDEWRSGEIARLFDVVGHPEAVKQLVARLKNEVFAGKDVKLRQMERRGQLQIS